MHVLLAAGESPANARGITTAIIMGRPAENETRYVGPTCKALQGATRELSMHVSCALK
jgi:hypothetical protein